MEITQIQFLFLLNVKEQETQKKKKIMQNEKMAIRPATVGAYLVSSIKTMQWYISFYLIVYFKCPACVC